MKSVKSIVYRYLTEAEFFNIYKPPGTEPGGGGQKYIDFPTRAVHLPDWHEFFTGVDELTTDDRAQGPSWTFPIQSIGVNAQRPQQSATIYQRRQQSVCIAAQHLHATGQNRVIAWHPDRGFPAPLDETDRHQLPTGLAIYLVRTRDNEIWAGWLQNSAGSALSFRTEPARELLESMLSDSEPGAASYLEFADNELWIEETDQVAPFTAEPLVLETQPEGEVRGEPSEGRPPAVPNRTGYRKRRSEEEILNSLFGEDEDEEADDSENEPQVRETTARVRRRNVRAVRDLKELYDHRCQITGDMYAFEKQDGTLYTEAHHLKPLGTGGADDTRNIIIISPLIHRMLHYANVSEIDLGRIEQREDGSSILKITINGETYTITWHPKHAERVQAQEIE